MRTEFNKLVELMQKYNLYKDEVEIAISELDKKITEVEKRLVCVSKTNKDISDIMFKFQEQITNVIGYDNMEVVERSINDINIAIDLTDKEPIDNNWYGLFEEPKKEEPKVLIPKGSILKWRKEIPYYSAKGGARAKVTQDYTTESVYVFVEWIDEFMNGQESGGYDRNGFEDEFELPKKILYTTTEQNIVEDIIQKLIQLEVDGETMEYIIDQVGMTDQMLRQFIMSKSYKETKDLLREKFELEIK